MSIVMAWVTCPDRSTAERIARAVVAERLAACVNLLPVQASIYRWKGRVQKAREVLMILKTRRSAFARLRKRIRGLHPYDVPEILATSVVAGDPDYLRWIRSSVR